MRHGSSSQECYRPMLVAPQAGSPCLMPCLEKRSCLAERERCMRIHGPTGWDNPCMNCDVGAARQLDGFVPEEGFGPNCLNCGAPIWKWSSQTGMCMECSHRGKRNSGNRSKREGVKAYWGYREKTTRIIAYQQVKKGVA